MVYRDFKPAGHCPTPVPFDLSAYSVLDLYNSGVRFCDDYDERAAIDQYMALHPQANRAAVERELQAAGLARQRS